MQPSLFLELSLMTPPAAANHAKAGRSLVGKLYAVRRTLSEDEKLYLDMLNAAIEQIRTTANTPATKLEDRILYAIERQGCFTIADLKDETRLSREKIIELLKTLIEKKLVRKVSRFIPGSDKPNFMFKSNRVDLGEMV